MYTAVRYEEAEEDDYENYVYDRSNIVKLDLGENQRSLDREALSNESTFKTHWELANSLRGNVANLKQKFSDVPSNEKERPKSVFEYPSYSRPIRSQDFSNRATAFQWNRYQSVEEPSWLKDRDTIKTVAVYKKYFDFEKGIIIHSDDESDDDESIIGDVNEIVIDIIDENTDATVDDEFFGRSHLISESKDYIVDSRKEKYGRRIQSAINELIQTEIKFVENLKHVIDDYIPSLVGIDISTSDDFTKQNIFANIEEIYEVHSTKFLPDLKKNRYNLENVAKIFVDYAKVFEIYMEYLQNQENSGRVVAHYKSYFTRIQDNLGRNLNLNSYLLAPVQRLPRYQLFLEDFLKSYKSYVSKAKEEKSKSFDENSVNDIVSTEDETESVITWLEMAKTSIKHILKTANNAMTLMKIEDFPVSVLRNSVLLQHDEFYVTNYDSGKSWTMHCLLFEEMLLLAKVKKSEHKDEIYRYYDFIETSKLGISIPNSEVQDKFSVWCEKRTKKNYILQTKNSYVSAEWVKLISSLLMKYAEIEKEKIRKRKGCKVPYLLPTPPIEERTPEIVSH